MEMNTDEEAAKEKGINKENEGRRKSVGVREVVDLLGDFE